MNRMRGGYGGSDSGAGGGGGFFGMGSQGGSGGVRYVCLVCNNKHKGGSCPRCGSKMQRAIKQAMDPAAKFPELPFPELIASQ